MSFDWQRWPYDPADVGREVMGNAIQALEDASHSGIDQVERAIGALQIAVSMLHSRVGQFDRHGTVLADLDRAHRDIHDHLQTAMDAIYQAASTADGIN